MYQMMGYFPGISSLHISPCIGHRCFADSRIYLGSWPYFGLFNPATLPKNGVFGGPGISSNDFSFFVFAWVLLVNVLIDAHNCLLELLETLSIETITVFLVDSLNIVRFMLTRWFYFTLFLCLIFNYNCYDANTCKRINRKSFTLIRVILLWWT